MLKDYTVIFFDMDGLLVNTEQLHFSSYRAMCRNRGYLLPWDFAAYTLAAHVRAEGLRDAIYAEFPELYRQEPDWSVLYAEKKRCYREVLLSEDISLMPGVRRMLDRCDHSGIRTCVVTNSFREHVDLIRERVPELSRISRWIVREDFVRPKPAPDPYRKALDLYAGPEDRAIGFEDTVRGVISLKAAGIDPILISSVLQPSGIDFSEKEKVSRFATFDEFLSVSDDSGF